VYAVVRRVRCGLLRCKVTAGTANHGERGWFRENIFEDICRIQSCLRF